MWGAATLMSKLPTKNREPLLAGGQPAATSLLMPCPDMFVGGISASSTSHLMETPCMSALSYDGTKERIRMALENMRAISISSMSYKFERTDLRTWSPTQYLAFLS